MDGKMPGENHTGTLARQEVEDLQEKDPKADWETMEAGRSLDWEASLDESPQG